MKLAETKKKRYRSMSSPVQNQSRSHGLPSVVNLRNKHGTYDRPDDESTLSNFHKDFESLDGSYHPDGGNIRHDSFDVPATDDDEDEERSLSSSNFFQGVQSEDGSWRPGDGIIPCRGPVQPRYFTRGTPRDDQDEERTLSSSDFFQGVHSEDGSWRPGDGIIPCRGRVQPRYFTKGK